MISVPGQKVELDPQAFESGTSRPLKTGAEFILVLPKHRFVYRHWDKENYLPGEEGELILEGKGLGKKPYDFIIETSENEDGPWLPVKTVKANVDGDKATAKFIFPKLEPKGHLTKAEWKRLKAKPEERLGMHVEASGYEGGGLDFVVEKQGADGEWHPYSRWQGNIDAGKADTVFAIPAGKAKPAKNPDARVVELAFDGDPEAGGVAWLLAETSHLDSEQMKFVLERADENGDWRELGEGVSTVKDGEARNGINVPVIVCQAGNPDPGGMVPIGFSHPLYRRGEELVVYVDPGWLKGEQFEVTLERRVMKGSEPWKEVAVVDAEPVSPTGAGGAGGGESGSGGTGSGESGSGGTGSGGTGSGGTGSGGSGSGGTGSGGTGSGGSGSGGTGSGGTGSGGTGSGGTGSGGTGSGGTGSGGTGSGGTGSGGTGSGGTGSGGSGSGGTGSGGTGSGGGPGGASSGGGTGSGGGPGGASSGGGAGGSGSDGSGGGTGGSTGSGGTGGPGGGSAGATGSGAGGGSAGATGSGAGGGSAGATGSGTGGAAGGAGAAASSGAGGTGAKGGGLSGLEIGGIVAGAGALGAVTAASVSAAGDAKKTADDAEKNGDDSAKVEE